MPGLDNREAERDPRSIAGGPHFQLRIGGKRIAYSYIRKNGCSAFKAMFARCSPHRDDRRPGEEDYEFLVRRHRVKKGATLARFDHAILVTRDPFDRAISVFKNKFVQRDGADGILASYAAITGLPPERATFADFVTRYLREEFASLDRHVTPQADHLRADIYTDAIPLADLHARMTPIVGAEIADAVFREPVNSTARAGQAEDPAAADLPAETLRERFLTGAPLPAATCFLTPPLRQRLAGLYARDLALLARVS